MVHAQRLQSNRRVPDPTWREHPRLAGAGGAREIQWRLAYDEKVPVLPAYLTRWKFEVGAFFEGVGPDSSDAEILAIAARHPAFEVQPVD